MKAIVFSPSFCKRYHGIYYCSKRYQGIIYSLQERDEKRKCRFNFHDAYICTHLIIDILCTFLWGCKFKLQNSFDDVNGILQNAMNM